MKMRSPSSGFSMLELVVTVTLILALASFAVPMVQSVLQDYRYRNAVTSVTMAIQATRFQAIRNGYPFAIEFDPATNTYQVSSQPSGAAAFSNVGPAIPLEGAAGVVISQPTRLQFSPNGMVQATVGSLSISMSYGSKTKTINVSRAGRVFIQ